MKASNRTKGQPVNCRSGGKMPRRQFLLQLAAGTGLLTAGLPGCAAVLSYRATLVNGRVPLDLSELEMALGEESGILIRAPGLPEPILLLRQSDGSFQAIGAQCTHLGCTVQPGTHFLICPCHGSTFDLEGSVVRGPAQRPLKRYRVETRPGGIEIVVA